MADNRATLTDNRATLADESTTGTGSPHHGATRTTTAQRSPNLCIVAITLGRGGRTRNGHEGKESRERPETIL